MCTCTRASWSINKSDSPSPLTVFSPFWGENFLVSSVSKHPSSTLSFPSLLPNQTPSKKGVFFFFFFFFILPKIPLPNTPLVFLLYLCLYFTSTSPYIYITSLSSCTCSLISLCLTQPRTCSCLNGSSSVTN